jgi:hypothetical protein
MSALGSAVVSTRPRKELSLSRGNSLVVRVLEEAIKGKENVL